MPHTPPIPLSDLDERTVDTWRNAGIVLIVGSLVSTFAPTNLPTGNATTNALWDRILRHTDRAYLGKDLEELKNVPFEAIMQCYPDRGAIKGIIQKLYCERKPNNLHRQLVSSLQSGEIKGLITTNYDLAFDSAITGTTDVFTVANEHEVESFRVVNASLANPPPIFFKIHGSAEAGYEETIVCDLNAERWLWPWKRELLGEMVRGRALVLIGYSGSDFDLCPELAETTRQAHTIWLQHDPKQTKPNAKRVLDRTKGVAVVGDLVEFLNCLLNLKLEVFPAEKRPVDLSGFDPALTEEWRLQLLNWIACPNLLQASIDDLKSVGTSFRRDLYGHLGRYREGIRELETESQSSNGSEEEEIRRRIHIASAKFIYGQHLRAWHMLNQASRDIDDQGSASEDLHTLVIEVRIMMYMRCAQIARALRQGRLLTHIQERAGSLYSVALKSLQELGAWSRLEALQQNAERIGIARSDAMPLPTRRGYDSLGLVAMHAIVQRDWIRTGSWRLSSKQQERAIECAERAEKYGWHHEAWKLNWILLLRGNGRKCHYLGRWHKHFWVTQYPPLARVFQLFVNLVPTGKSGDFEDEIYW